MSRHLPEFPNLDHLKKQARELLGELRQLNPDVRLSAAQGVLARQYGFAAWPQLKAHVESLAQEHIDRRKFADFVKSLAEKSLSRAQAARSGGIFARCTEGARRSIFFARFESHQHGRDSIGAEHLLLGLLRPGGTIDRVFERSGLSPEHIRAAVENRIVQSNGANGEFPVSPECRAALEAAAEEADCLVHAMIDTPHLLLGLLHDTNSVAGAVLVESGVRLDELRGHVLAVLSEEVGPN